MFPTMFVPFSLKKTESEIIQELEREGIKAFFQIRDFDQKTGHIEIALSSKDSTKELSPRIQVIVDKYLSEWRKTYT